MRHDPLTSRERSIMEHACAWSHRSRFYRNHYVSGPDSSEWAALQSLCERGLMFVRLASIASTDRFGGMSVFAVTQAGFAALEAA